MLLSSLEGRLKESIARISQIDHDLHEDDKTIQSSNPMPPSRDGLRGCNFKRFYLDVRRQSAAHFSFRYKTCSNLSEYFHQVRLVPARKTSLGLTSYSMVSVIDTTS